MAMDTMKARIAREALRALLQCNHRMPKVRISFDAAPVRLG
jgi:hypothetical protein